MIQEQAPAHGQIVRVWHVTMVTNAQVETLAAVDSAQPRLSLVTRIVSTVMAPAAALKQDLDSRTTSAHVK